MKKSGFTQIELLVVVLIIGILAAVALPQYEKAVAKSRFSEAALIVKSMRDACAVLAMERGLPECTWNNEKEISDLDIDIPGENYTWGGWNGKKTKNFFYTLNSPGGGPVAYYLQGMGSGTGEGAFSLCVYAVEGKGDIEVGYNPYAKNNKAESICKSIGLTCVESAGECW